MTSPTTEDKYGFSVGAAGDVIAVGAPFHRGANQAVGRVYIDGVVLSPTPAVFNSGFGTDVATDGTTLVAGKWRPWNGEVGGTYEVFRRNGAAWMLVGTLSGGPRARFDDDGTFTLGGSIYDAATLVAVGSSGGLRAEKEGATSVGCSGNVQVFERDAGGVWNLAREFPPGPAGSPSATCGDIAYSASTAAIFVPSAASVFIHQRDASGAGQWGHVKTIPTSLTPDVKVDLEDGRLIVVEYNGEGRLFHRNKGGPQNWGQVGTFPSPSGSRFGWDIDMDGDRALGSREHGPCCGGTSGSVLVFDLNAADAAVAFNAPTQVVAGEDYALEIIARNDGSSTARAVSASWVLPAALLNVSVSGCPTLQSPATCLFGDVPPETTRTITLNGKIEPFFRGNLAGSASVSMSSPETSSGNENASFSTNVIGVTDVAVTKTDNRMTATPGLNLVYVVRFANGGPSGAPAVSVFDTLPALFSQCQWGVSASGGATGGTNGSGHSIGAVLRMPPASALTYSVNCQIPPDATGVVQNEAMVSELSEDPDDDDHSATDETTFVPEADLSISKSDGLAEVPFGASLTYQIDVFNSGPSVTGSATFDDQIPEELSDVSWSCSAAAGSSCPASGTGSPIGIPVALGAMSGASLTVSGTVTNPADRLIHNEAMIWSTDGDPDLADNTAVDQTTILMPDGMFKDGFEESGPQVFPD